MPASDQFVGVESSRGMMRSDVAGALREVDAPLVLINSSYRPTKLSAATALHPNTTLQLMDDVGHFAMMED
jgi:pimeloyl-ACP methyl ester carboxylesterase